MKPHLTTSPRPATSSVARQRRAASTGRTARRRARGTSRRGSCRCAVLMPVLPPTAASTMPSRVVGTCTTRTPRSQVAATKPPRSVVAPPPNVTTASERVKPASPSASQHDAATVGASWRARRRGRRARMTSYAAASESSTGRTSSARASGKTTATRWTSTPEHRGSRSREVVPDDDVVRRLRRRRAARCPSSASCASDRSEPVPRRSPGRHPRACGRRCPRSREATDS